MRRPSWPLLCLLPVAVAAAVLNAGAGAQPRSKAPAAAPPPAEARPPVPAQAAPPAVPGARSPRNASYSIDVTLEPQTRTLTGRAVLTWRNIASVGTSELRLHLYYNAWKNTRSTWMRERQLAGRAGTPGAGDWGWVDVTAVRLLPGNATPVDLTAQKHYVSPDDGNPDDRTVLAIPLPQEVAPGATVSVELAWTSRIPRTFARTGGIGDYYFLAQWFPKVGVLEDTGWNCHQFHAGTEFYADYGIYDVRMTVPRGWVVGATGQERSRRDNGDEATTFGYHAEDVHDFAWTTSPDYLERRARFEHATLPPVDMRLLLQPEHADQADRHFEATRVALRYYGEWFGPYPYGYITIVDPAWQSGAGGMEYPTLFTAGSRWIAPAGVTQPEGVTVHEAGHQFWYALVGNNEFEHAWLDEGFNTFSTARAIDAYPPYHVNYLARRYFGGFVPYVFRDIVRSREVDGDGLAGYRASAKSDAQSTPTWQYFPATGGGLSYNKTALWLETLERYLGWPTLRRILATHFSRWKFGHPKPQDFFAIVNEVSGRDMTWFFDQVYRSSNVFDYAVGEVRSVRAGGDGFVERNGREEPITPSAGPVRYRTTVVARRLGEALFPVDVEVVFDNGEKVVERWNGRERWRAFTFDRPARPSRVTIDPGRVLLLDLDRTNNSWVSRPAAGAAAHKWALKWIVWLQDALLNGAFFV